MAERTHTRRANPTVSRIMASDDDILRLGIRRIDPAGEPSKYVVSSIPITPSRSAWGVFLIDAWVWTEADANNRVWFGPVFYFDGVLTGMSSRDCLITNDRDLAVGLAKNLTDGPVGTDSDD
jgi:hypothetical protein